MSTQKYKIDLGDKGQASMMVNSPVFKFWKRPDVLIDLSECAEDYRRLGLTELTKQARGNLTKREFHIHFHFG